MKPVTRKEMFMEALANGCACAVEPTTREEMYLAAQAEREASGGSGGGGLTIRMVYKEYTTDGSQKFIVEPVPAGTYEKLKSDLLGGNPDYVRYLVEHHRIDSDGTSIFDEFIAGGYYLSRPTAESPEYIYLEGYSYYLLPDDRIMTEEEFYEEMGWDY